MTLHVWSRTGGKKQVHDIIEAIKSTLHDQPVTLVDHDLVNLRHEFSEARPDPDGDTFHGIVRYRAVTEPSQAKQLSTSNPSASSWPGLSRPSTI